MTGVDCIQKIHQFSSYFPTLIKFTTFSQNSKFSHQFFLQNPPKTSRKKGNIAQKPPLNDINHAKTRENNRISSQENKETRATNQQKFSAMWEFGERFLLIDFCLIDW
jgi:hypothetical protein